LPYFYILKIKNGFFLKVFSEKVKTLESFEYSKEINHIAVG